MARPKKEIVLFVFALTIFFPIVKSQTFDDFWLVQQWPAAVCSLQSGQCVGSGIRTFTIHGVWPQKGGNSVLNCPGNSFDLNKIANLETTLNKLWPNLITGDNHFFWGYEWNKHGICSESKYNQAAYFQMAINMRYKIDLIGTMRVGGVVPNGASKAKQRVESAIFAGYKAYPILRCKSASNGNVLLTEVVTCFDDDGVTLLNCTRSRSNCPASFIF